MFLQNLKGTKVAEQFMREHDRLQAQLRELEDENAKLRAKVEADSAIRELLEKIESLEHEKKDLLSRFHAVEAASSEVHARVHEIETEFSNLANLFVASNQIHASLSPRGVMRRVKEVLAQLVGAERYCVYFSNPDRTELVPIAFEGIPGAELGNIRMGQGPIGEVFKTGAARVVESDPSSGSLSAPAAVVPLAVDDQIVGVIAIFGTLSQKKHFDTIDFELFKLLGQHAAAALVSASLFSQAERKIPGLEAFVDLSRLIPMAEYSCLIVEDSPMMRQLLVFALARVKNLRVTEADDGVDGLRKLASARYDIIVTDINMPIMDGLKLVKRVRSDPVHKDTPIVIITTEGSQEDRQRALQLGANAYITKPIQAPQVIATVKELLKIE